MTESGLWERIRSAPEAMNWPSWQTKIMHAASRLFLASELLDIGDLDAAAEELLYSASHSARAVLLRREVFPLSRPEMIDQLNENGFARLSSTLAALLSGDTHGSALERAQQYLKKLLVYEDRETYRETAAAHRKRRLSKATGLGLSRLGRDKSEDVGG
jgi:uncharacterized protein (UPF0332 family)